MLFRSGHAHGFHHFSQLDGVPNLFSLLKEAGVKTALIGKKHVGPDKNYPIDVEQDPGRNLDRVAKLSAEFLAGVESAPFLLVVGFHEPHRAAKGFGNPPGDGHRPEPVVPHYLPDQPEVRADLADYLRAVERLDQGVAKLLAALEASGRARETTVIFLSDNGIPFPGAKTNLYDPGVRLPLIVRSPKIAQAGATSPAMVSWVDVAPTVLDLLDAPAKLRPRMHGRSIAPLLKSPQAPGWDEVTLSHTFHEVTMYYPMRGVRDRRYKLLWNLAAPLPFPFASDLYDSPTWQCVEAKKLEIGRAHV